MTTNQRGCRNLLLFLVIAFFGCILIPFILLPAVRQAVVLPVITVPAEYYLKDWPSPDFELVNSLGGAVVAMIIVFAIALVVRSHSKGWTKEVPGRFQALVEIIVDGLWGLTKQQAGNKPRVRNLLFPLVASLFLYLLAGNWGKLLPGVETVGVLHCAAYEPNALNGFPVQEATFLGRPYFILRSDAPLNTGTPGYVDAYHRCEGILGVTAYEKYRPTLLDPYLDQRVTHTVQQGDTLANIAARYNDEVTAKISQPIPDLSNYVDIPYQGWETLSFTPADIIAANVAEDGTVAIASAVTEAAGEDSEETDHSKLPAVVVAQQEATDAPTIVLPTSAANTATAPLEAVEATAEVVAEPVTQVVGEATAEAGGVITTEDTHSEGDTHSDGETTTVAAVTTLDETTPLAAGQTIVIRDERTGAAATTLHNQIFTVAPFVRGMTTDLSFTIGLALLAFFAIQYFGVSELGLNYFQKFINVQAIGNIAKKPLGVIDFVVGLFEIISELGKIVSLSFRLFGAIFAGTVLFAVIMFLVGTTIPAIILLLEIIVGFAQAAVFAVLTLIFSAQAMVSHIHDDDHGHGHDDEHGQPIQDITA